MNNSYNKYAHLLTHYCLEVQKGDRVLLKSTYLAEPLLIELLKEITKAGGHPVLDIEIQKYESSLLLILLQNIGTTILNASYIFVLLLNKKILHQ
jgi:leucyl aminopeptidase (aminopeptidase T)